MMAAVAVGIYENLAQAKAAFVKEKNEYLPRSSYSDKYKGNYDAYKKIYNAVRPIIEVI